MLNRLEMLRIFCVAAESNSFKEAAVRLGTSPQAVTRAVKELEQHVGELLFHRNTRRNHITTFGAQLAARARHSVQQMDELFRRDDQQAAHELSGIVRITAPNLIGRRYLMPLLTQLARDFPHIQLELRLSDLIADVIDEQIDIGVRVGVMRDSRIVAKPVANVSFYVVATPELLARTRKPETPQDLASLPTTMLIDRKTGRGWPWLFSGAQPFTPDVATLATDDSDAECDAVLAGLGYGQLPSFLAEPLLQAGQLVSVLDEYAPEPWQLFVYRPQRGPVAARVRLVFDRIAAMFADSTTYP